MPTRNLRAVSESVPHRAVRAWLRRIGILFGALVGVMLLSAVAAAIWVHTDGGHRFVARRIEAFVGGQIAGSLRIGVISDVSWRGLRARDLHFAAPDGDDVLVVNDADVDVRWGALIARRFVVVSAIARGGRVILHDQGGGLDFDLAFRRPHNAGPRAPAEPLLPPPVDIGNVEATGFVLSTRARGVPGAAGTDLDGHVHVWLPFPGARPRLDVRGLSGHVAIQTAFPIVMAITSGTLHYDASSRERAAVEMQGVINDVRVRWLNSITMQNGVATVESRLVVPNVGGVLREAPLLAEASVADLTTSGFDFRVQIAPRMDGRTRENKPRHTQ